MPLYYNLRACKSSMPSTSPLDTITMYAWAEWLPMTVVSSSKLENFAHDSSK